MAQFSMHAYDADVWIPEFKGLNQADVNMNPDLRFAAELQNVETPNGVLQPRAAAWIFGEQIGTLKDRYITMLQKFHRRNYTGDGTKDWLVCFAWNPKTGEGEFYYAHGIHDYEWTEIGDRFIDFNDRWWSSVCYEQTAAGKTVDVMLVTNKQDGMYMIVPPDRPTAWGDETTFPWTEIRSMTWGQVKSEEWSIVRVDTRGKKFGIIERYADRVWGGDIAGNPDMLMYSAVYLPTEWRPYKPDAAPDDPDWGIGQPEDGGGDILQPSWDGDKFTGLKQFGDSLIALKEHHIWRVEGTNPGAFEFREQFGGGTSYGNTLEVYGEKMFMVAKDGMYVYDGMTVTPFKHKEVEKLWPSFMQPETEYADMLHINTCIHDGRYYVSSIENTMYVEGEDNGKITSRTIVVNLTENTVLYYTNSGAHCFVELEDEYYYADALFASSSYYGSKPGCDIRMIGYDAFATNLVYAEDSRWVSPWIDFGYKRIQKGGFDLYFVPEVKDQEVTIYFSIQTEKKLKTKAYTVKPLTEEQRAKPKEHRGKRLHFGGMGRKFRVIIEVKNSAFAPWRLIGGLQLVVETDPD